ncbi:hypothetical protein INT45_008937 [Circinella minor]|uniref:Uncharacterized protein n=1 Tax=Circinella minor TaxID=1195481 RepID=A0A8H7VQA3_9FUNG|nr:hypothetical protein INT45_008937 [Circinella minor]
MIKSKKNNAKNADEAARLARWSSSAYSTTNFSVVTPLAPENKKLLGFGSPKQYVADVGLKPIEHDDLKQGSLYIVKIRNVSVALFEGWDDDMCCFAVLRSESTPMRWSEARYIPGDFDAYDAFDEAGNPPVHLWTQQLRVNVPTNWFSIFEEARRKQRDWMHEQNEEQEEYYYSPGEQTAVAPPQRQLQQANNPASITPPASTGKSADDKVGPGSSHNNDEESEKAPSTSSADNHPTGDDEEVSSSAGSAQPELNEESVKGDGTAPNSTSVTTITAATTAPSTENSETKSATNGVSIPTKQQPRTTIVKEHEPTPISKYEPALNPLASTKQQLATPPVSPNASEQVRKYQASSEKSRVLSTTDFAFPHNGDQFSFGQEVSNPSVPPLNINTKKINSSGSNDAAVPKSKRRSVQDLFRSGK